MHEHHKVNNISLFMMMSKSFFFLQIILCDNTTSVITDSKNENRWDRYLPFVKIFCVFTIDYDTILQKLLNTKKFNLKL